MSDESHWPFDLLGLTVPEPSKKDIRRAYAKKLKQIDQERDIEGFEALRTAYQVALSIADSPQTTEPPAASVFPDELDDADMFDAHNWADMDPLNQSTPSDDHMAGLSEQGQALLALIDQRQDGESDALRLMGVISDPLMSDPLVAQAVEQEIYYYLFAKIDAETSVYPTFDLAAEHNGIAGEQDEFRVRQLMDKLDERFGWLSDQIGMQRRFVGYDTFLDAALNLSPTTQITNTKASWISKVGTILWVLLVGVILSGKLFTPLGTPPPAQHIQFQDPSVFQDAEFLEVLENIQLRPSQKTLEFLNNLAEEQGFAEKSTRYVDFITAKGWAVSTNETKIAGRSLADDENLDEIKYFAGVFLAARYQLMTNLGYRDTRTFNLNWDPVQNIGHWKITEPGANNDRLWPNWPADGGFMVADYQDPDPDVFRAVYPEAFFRAMLNATGRDPRALEGALGLKAYTLDRQPYLRAFYYPKISIPGFTAATVDVDHHYLNHTGLGSNRWPIRAAPILNEACEILTISSTQISTAHRC